MAKLYFEPSEDAVRLPPAGDTLREERIPPDADWIDGEAPAYLRQRAGAGS